MELPSLDYSVVESKYSLPKIQEGIFLRRLRMHALVPVEFSHANIRTIYFDDAGNTSYFDSRDGHLLRLKYRLREYVGADQGGAHYSLEMKLRFDQKTKKIKVLVYKRLPQNYSIGTFGNLIDDLRRFCGVDVAPIASYALGLHLRPAATVGYERFRFDARCGTVRYNLDRNVCVYPRAHNLCLNARLQARRGMRLDYDIFEIKGKDFCDIPFFLRNCGLEPLSVSKFIWARETLFGY